VTVRLRDTDEEVLVRDVFRAFFAEHASTSRVRAAEPLGYDANLWCRLCAMGAPAMGVGCAAGGGGASLTELAVVAEELGRALAPVPLLEHQVAAQLLSRCDYAAFAEVLSGELVSTIALRPAVRGTWATVGAGAVADVVVGIRDAETVVVRRPAEESAIANCGTQPLANVSLRGDSVTVLGPAALLEPAKDAWRVLTAASLLGAAECALQVGLHYVGERHQFGRPLASFQAVQHGFADLPGLLNGVRLLVGKATWALDRDEAGVADLRMNDITDGRVLASMAFLFSAEAAATVVDRVLHYEGAIGCTLENDVQLYYRRVRSWPLQLGPHRYERRRLADLLLEAA
jgi:alkylation response protein AidB-like acyl-CoA dehydrogenase